MGAIVDCTICAAIPSLINAFHRDIGLVAVGAVVECAACVGVGRAGFVT